jgi:4-amino-4-deoxy-L-arabinose transferase-like glycosyltransferase
LNAHTELRWVHWGVALSLLLLFFARGAAAIPRLSLTADEPAFLGPGYAYLSTGDLRLEKDAAHPPLLFALTAAPLLLQPGPDVMALPGWAEGNLSMFARAFVTALGDGLEAATFAARLPILLLALLGAALVFRWAADWFGAGPGLLALAFFAFDPNIIAHATLATTDLGLAVFGFASAYLLLRLLRREPRQRSKGLVLTAGLALGLTLGTKSSGVFGLAVLVPLFLAARLVPLVRRTPFPWVSVRRALAQAALLVGLALFVLWALYGFEVRSVEGLGNMPLPFATQWEIWLRTRVHAQEGHAAFLMGQVSHTGWRAYYPIAFALKTPLPALMLLAVATLSFLRRGPRRWWAESLLWVYPISYGLVTIFSTIAIGYRFLLVVLPFVYVCVARLATSDRPPASGFTFQLSRFVLYASLLWHVVGTVRIHPHYLTFFNEIAGGPKGGHRYLVDSNLDWGQSFKALRAYLDQQEVEKVWLSYYTYTDPALYDIQYQPIAPSPGSSPVLSSRFDPAPGVYVLGATTLQGVMVVDQSTYDWFRHREPIGRPGNALFVYRVDPHVEPPSWLAQCTVPVASLPAEAAEEGFGQSGLRLAYFDCTSAWLYPGGGTSPGWYGLFRDTAKSDDPFIQARLAGTRLNYEQRQTEALPPFAIYELTSQPDLPFHTPDGPVQVGHLTLLGYGGSGESPAQPGQTVEVESWWRVEGLPERPLSIMMHLVGPEGDPAVVGDGLGVPIQGWQVGDVIVQRHRLPLPADASQGEYTLTTGVYWLDTMERWPVERAGEPVGDRLSLKVVIRDVE